MGAERLNGRGLVLRRREIPKAGGDFRDSFRPKDLSERKTVAAVYQWIFEEYDLNFAVGFASASTSTRDS
jgi:hypothetical protein